MHTHRLKQVLGGAKRNKSTTTDIDNKTGIRKEPVERKVQQKDGKGIRKKGTSTVLLDKTRACVCKPCRPKDKATLNLRLGRPKQRMMYCVCPKLPVWLYYCLCTLHKLIILHLLSAN